MEYRAYLEEFGATLRDARVAKGWSQRELAAKSGITQANISKIETGQVDAQLSSFMELARFLDLELTLAPRQAAPAIDAIIRDTQAARVPPGVARNVARISDASRELVENPVGASRAGGPFNEAAHDLAIQAANVQRLAAAMKAPYAAHELERIADIVDRVKSIMGSPGARAQIDFVEKNRKTIDLAARRVQEATRALTALRNGVAHGRPDETRSVYSLDDEEDGQP